MKTLSGSAVHIALNIVIAAVWMINGLFCKVLHLVPRHEQIVSEILGNDHSGAATSVIGVLEILMALWILSGIRKRLCALSQAVIVALMNTIEFLLVPDLLLFGRTNALVAAFFITVVVFNGYFLASSSSPKTA
jgi:hypothetical protein